MSAKYVLRSALAAGLCLSSALLGSAAFAGETAPFPRPRPSVSDLGKFSSLLISGSLDRLHPLGKGQQRFLIDPRWQ